MSIYKGSVNGVPFAKVDKILREALWDRDLEINICTNEITVPSAEDRAKIIEENHASAIEGHKGVTKTHLRIRERHVVPHERTDTPLHREL
ncbi:hypothetical protein P5V15_015021 [Pogonomyrmex californicus]